MSGGSGREEAFFEGAPPPPTPRRPSPLLARSPGLAALVLVAAGWLLWSLLPDTLYFLASRTPIDLGGPGAYRLEAARENRLAQIRGELVEQVQVTEARSGAQRTVGRLAGTNLLVDRPGRGGPPVFEGRILPARARADYAEVARVMRARGSPLGEAWLVLRDGERPRERPWPAVGALVCLALLAVNLRALVRALHP
ncbi:MAG TPA: hypothetical protein VML50_15990 [Anaeromyxobacter sp.]|nr:hypothetical protein [Anaeromyxobacter sp.]